MLQKLGIMRSLKRHRWQWGLGSLAAMLLVPLLFAYEQVFFEWVRGHYPLWQQWVAAHPVSARLGYLLVFSVVIGFFIPGGAVLLLLSGALFPFYEAIIWGSIGNLIGAVLNFLIARRFGKPWAHRHYHELMEQMHKGMEESGWLYLLVLRIAPVVPSPLVNIGMGLTHISVAVYGFITVLGRVPMTAVYAYFGRELGQIPSLSHLLSFETALILTAVGAAMLIANAILRKGVKTA